MSDITSRIGKSFSIVSIVVTSSFTVLLMLTLCIYSFDAFQTKGWNLLFESWNPAVNEYGIMPMLYGTLLVTFIGVIIAVPLGVCTAIFTSEMLPGRYRFYVKSILELLAGIPSIIYGLIGIAIFSMAMSNFFNLSSGRTILTAGLLVSIMILPTIITLSDDALHTVSQTYREAARGLGLYNYHIIRYAVFPIALPGIIGAVLLALGRALGETMAVMLVIGGLDEIPDPLFNIFAAGQTITSKIGREILETPFDSIHFSALISMSVILLLVNIFVTAVAYHFFIQKKRYYE